jgi:hypothetical protein
MKVLANQFYRPGFITLGLLNRALDRQHFGLRLAGRMSWISCGVVAWHGKFNCLVESPEQTSRLPISITMTPSSARTFTSSLHKIELENIPVTSAMLVAVTRLLAVLAHPWLGQKLQYPATARQARDRVWCRRHPDCVG